VISNSSILIRARTADFGAPPFTKGENDALAEAAGQPLQPARAVTNWSFIFIAVCCSLFLICVFLRLNGSSAPFWARALPALNGPMGLIAGNPRLTRSDEWLVWTPAALSQLHHIPPMPVENPALGAAAAPLLMSLPVRHYSMLFRPQLWGFFVFDAERGFSWFWNTKILGLLLSYFLLFRLVTRGRVGLAILGSVAVSYSSCVQWFFSSPTMLPEMMASWALMLVAGKSLFDPSSAWRKIGAATLLGSSAINFALCCYPPFQIPLLYLGLTLFGAFGHWSSPWPCCGPRSSPSGQRWKLSRIPAIRALAGVRAEQCLSSSCFLGF
jgi:hypothetical protein